MIKRIRWHTIVTGQSYIILITISPKQTSLFYFCFTRIESWFFLTRLRKSWFEYKNYVLNHLKFTKWKLNNLPHSQKLINFGHHAAQNEKLLIGLQQLTMVSEPLRFQQPETAEMTSDKTLYPEKNQVNVGWYCPINDIWCKKLHYCYFYYWRSYLCIQLFKQM